jgi:hypothetical protein
MVMDKIVLDVGAVSSESAVAAGGCTSLQCVGELGTRDNSRFDLT